MHDFGQYIAALEEVPRRILDGADNGIKWGAARRDIFRSMQPILDGF